MEIHSQETYAKLVAAYREKPGNANHAGKAAGTSRGFALKAWKEGFPKHGAWATPIKDRIQQEEVGARAQMQRLAPQIAALEVDAHKDAIASRVIEASMVRDGRTLSGRILQQLHAYAEVIDALIRVGREQTTKIGNDPKMKLIEITEILQRFAESGKSALAMVKTCFELERKLLGEPDVVVGVELKNASTGELRDIILDYVQLQDAVNRGEIVLTD